MSLNKNLNLKEMQLAARMEDRTALVSVYRIDSIHNFRKHRLQEARYLLSDPQNHCLFF